MLATTRDQRVVDVGHLYMYSRSSTLLQWVKAVLELAGYKTQWVAFGGTTRGSRECGRIEIQNDSEEPYKGVITIMDEGQLSELDNIDLHEYVTNQLKNGDVIINRLILLSSDQPWAKTEQYISEIKNHRDIKYYQVGCNFARCLVCNTTEELGSRLVIKKNGKVYIDCTGQQKADHTCGAQEHYVTICRKCQKECEHSQNASAKLLELIYANIQNNDPAFAYVVINNGKAKFKCDTPRIRKNCAATMNELFKESCKMRQLIYEVCSYVGVSRNIVDEKLLVLRNAILPEQ